MRHGPELTLTCSRFNRCMRAGACNAATARQYYPLPEIWFLVLRAVNLVGGRLSRAGRISDKMLWSLCLRGWQVRAYSNSQCAGRASYLKNCAGLNFVRDANTPWILICPAIEHLYSPGFYLFTIDTIHLLAGLVIHSLLS
jgi:hypothetical protein